MKPLPERSAMDARAMLHRLGGWKAVAAIVLAQVAFTHALSADPVKIAVLDFQLEDASAGAAMAGDGGADGESMKAVNAAVRQEIEKSGRYRIVDATDAEQSLAGVVRRITRTEYVVGFQLRDTKTGAMLASRQTDLRMGANYSWSRGAAALIRNELSENPR